MNSSHKWREYLTSPDLGITYLSWQEYRLHNPSGDITVRSMLTLAELALLYHLARDRYSGRGAILDLGPLLGLGTNMLARGISANRQCRDRRSKLIYSFDLFLSDGMGHYVENCVSPSGSVFEAFMEITSDYRDLICVSPGDFAKMHWMGGPIEILFVDIAKTVDLNWHVIEQTFPELLRNSVVVQQDYVYFDQYWIAYTMEFFSEHFSAPQFAFGGTAYFSLEKPITPAQAAEFRNLSIRDRLNLIDRAIDKAPISVAPVLRCGKAKMLHDLGRTAEAQEVLALAIPAADVDTLCDFSQIAASNRKMVAAILDSTESGGSPGYPR